MKALKILIGAVLMAALVTACWDSQEIDKRLFVGIIGVDLSPEPEKKYVVHFTAPIVREISSGEGGGSGSEKPPILLVSSLADSVMEALKNLDLRINRFLFLEHSSCFIIGEDAAREGIREIINPFWRNMVFNRRGHIVIAEGPAKKALEVRPRVEQLLTEYLVRLFSQERLTGKYYNSELGKFMSHINSEIGKGNALVSRLVPDKDEVNIGGAAVIKDFKLIGWLTPVEIEGVNLCLGTMKGGNLIVMNKELQGVATLKINSAKRKIHLTEDGDIPKFLIEIFIEGEIESSSIDMVITKEEAKMLCGSSSKELKEHARKGIEKLQKDYEVDLIDLGKYLNQFHPGVWKRYKQDWDEIFPEVDIEIKVETKIRSFGVTT